MFRKSGRRPFERPSKSCTVQATPCRTVPCRADPLPGSRLIEFAPVAWRTRGTLPISGSLFLLSCRSCRFKRWHAFVLATSFNRPTVDATCPRSNLPRESITARRDLLTSRDTDVCFFWSAIMATLFSDFQGTTKTTRARI